MEDITFLTEDLLHPNNLPFADERKKPLFGAISPPEESFDFGEFINNPASPVSLNLTESHNDSPSNSASNQDASEIFDPSFLGDFDSQLFFDSMQDNTMVYESMSSQSAFATLPPSPPEQMDVVPTPGDILSSLDPSALAQAARIAAAAHAANQAGIDSKSLFNSYFSQFLAKEEERAKNALDSTNIVDPTSLTVVKTEEKISTSSSPVPLPTPIQEKPAANPVGRPRRGKASKDQNSTTSTSQPPKKRSRAKKDEEDGEENEDDENGEETEFLVPLPQKPLSPDLARQYEMLKDPSLSSKERRQLRNKLSARSFRERRKDYIEALEGEVRKLRKELAESKQRVEASEVEKAHLNDLVSSLSQRMRRMEISSAAGFAANSSPRPSDGHFANNRQTPLSPEQDTPLSSFSLTADTRSGFGSLVRSSRFSPASAANQASMRPKTVSPLSVHTVIVPEAPHPSTSQAVEPTTDPETLAKISKLLAFLNKSSPSCTELPTPTTSSKSSDSMETESKALTKTQQEEEDEERDIRAAAISAFLTELSSVPLATKESRPVQMQASSAAVSRSLKPCCSVEATPNVVPTTALTLSPSPLPSTPQLPSKQTPWSLMDVARKAMKVGDLSGLTQAVVDELFPSQTFTRISEPNQVGVTTLPLFSSLPAHNEASRRTTSSPFSSPKLTPRSPLLPSSPVAGSAKIVTAMDVDTLVTSCLKGRGVVVDDVNLSMVKMVLIFLLSANTNAQPAPARPSPAPDSNSNPLGGVIGGCFGVQGATTLRNDQRVPRFGVETKA
ncbi:hypothetical protein HDU97_005218 [Phlyctochytrium planicorne]|nr:hypothetical protein HDU97_005218 [Phlyctochytrium planicorne]